MRIYIIGNDGITVSGEAPAALNESEIAVASKEELHGAPPSPTPVLTKPADRKLTACEPVVSILTEVAKLLRPGRCMA